VNDNARLAFVYMCRHVVGKFEKQRLAMTTASFCHVYTFSQLLINTCSTLLGEEKHRKF
jgi:hypothetical protein